MSALPNRYRVFAVLIFRLPLFFMFILGICFVMRALNHKHGVCERTSNVKTFLKHVAKTDTFKFINFRKLE